MEVKVIQDTYTVVREKLVFEIMPDEAVMIEDMIARGSRIIGGSKAREITSKFSGAVDMLSKESLVDLSPRITDSAVDKGKRLILAQMKKMSTPGSSHLVLQAELICAIRQLSDTVGVQTLRRAMSELTSGDSPVLTEHRMESPGSPIALKWADTSLVFA